MIWEYKGKKEEKQRFEKSLNPYQRQARNDIENPDLRLFDAYPDFDDIPEPKKDSLG